MFPRMGNAATLDAPRRRVHRLPMAKIARSSVGENIRRLRNGRGWTQEELAERSGLSSVKMIETGRRTGLVGSLRKIALALDVPLAEIVAETDQEMPHALQRFLETPMGADVTDEEFDHLRALRFPGRTMTVQAYNLALLAIRATSEEE